MAKALLTAALIQLPVFLYAASNEEDGTIKLPPFSDRYKWHEFVISRDRPLSIDGRFKFLHVLQNGSVEVFRLDVSDSKEKPIIVKPLSEGWKKNGLPALVVVSADFKKQIARLKELRTN